MSQSQIPTTDSILNDSSVKTLPTTNFIIEEVDVTPPQNIIVGDGIADTSAIIEEVDVTAPQNIIAGDEIEDTSAIIEEVTVAPPKNDGSRDRTFIVSDVEDIKNDLTANLMAGMEVIDRPRSANAGVIIEGLNQLGETGALDFEGIDKEFNKGLSGEQHPMLGDFFFDSFLKFKNNPEEYPIASKTLKAVDDILYVPYKLYDGLITAESKENAAYLSFWNLVSCGDDAECRIDKLTTTIEPLFKGIKAAEKERDEVGSATGLVAYTAGFIADVAIDPITYTNPIIKFTKMGARFMVPDAVMDSMVKATGESKVAIKKAFLSTDGGQSLAEAADQAWSFFSTKHSLKKLGTGVVGDTAYDLASKFKNLIAAARVKSVRDNVELQKRIIQFSKDTKVPVEDINKFITEAVERGGIPNVDLRHLDSKTLEILSKNDDIRYEVWSLAQKNKAQLHKEIESGVKLTPIGENPLIHQNGDTTLYLQYMNHAITPEALKIAKKIELKNTAYKGTNVTRIKDWFTNKHTSTFKRREDWAGLTLADINKLAKEGKLPGYEGTVFKTGFFHDSPAILQSMRDNKHYRSLAATELSQALIGPQGMGLSPDALIGLAKNAGLVAKKGKKITPDEALKYLQEHNPKEYVSWEITKNKYTAGWAMPDDVAKFVDDSLEFINSPKQVNIFLTRYDEMTRWLKSWTLSIFPSYHVRNGAGNMWNNFVSGVHLKDYKTARKVQLGIANGKAGHILVKGEKVSYNQIRDWVDSYGVTGRGLFTADIETSLRQELGEGKWLTLSSKNKAIEKGKRVGEAVEDNARFANFINGLQKGMSPEDAAKRVRKTLFDYSDLTPFEQGVMKRLMPFYTWTRKNVPFQVEMMLKHPGKYKAIDTLRQEVEAATGDEDENEKYLASWMLASYPTKVRVKNGKAEYFLLGGWWPGADLWKVASQPSKLALDLLHPVLKVPLEMMLTNVDKEGYTTDLFTGQKLHNELQTDYLFGTVSETNKHYLNNLRVLSTIDEFIQAAKGEKKKLSPFSREPKTIEESMLAFLTGIRTFSVDLENQKLFSMMTREQQIKLYKKLIQKAVKNGRPEKEIQDLLNKQKKLVNKFSDSVGYSSGGVVSTDCSSLEGVAKQLCLLKKKTKDATTFQLDKDSSLSLTGSKDKGVGIRYRREW